MARAGQCPATAKTAEEQHAGKEKGERVGLGHGVDGEIIHDKGGRSNGAFADQETSEGRRRCGGGGGSSPS